MLPILKSNFIILPGADESVSDLRGRIRNHLHSQVEALIGHSVGLDSAGKYEWQTHAKHQSDDGKTVVRWTGWQHSQDRTLSLIENRLGYQFKGRPWEVELRFGTIDDCGYISAVWRTDISTTLTRPPRLLSGLAKSLTGETILEESTRVPFYVHHLTNDKVPSFCSEVLWNSLRRVPIIVISPSQWVGPNRIDATEVASRMFGLSLVYVLADTAAVEQFRLKVGQTLACYDGAIRIYLPMQESDRALRHPYCTATKLHTMSSLAFQKWLFEEVRRVSCHDLAESAALYRLTQIRLDEEAARWRSGEEDFGNLFDQWERLSKENEDLKRDKTWLEEQISQKQRQWDDERKNLENKVAMLRHQLSQKLQSDLEVTEQDIPSIFLSKRAAETYAQASASQKHSFEREIKKIGTQLARTGQIKAIPHDRTDCVIFPQGGKPERIFFYSCGEKVNICELASHHDESYENLLVRGVYRADYPLTDSVAWDSVSLVAQS